MSRVAENSRPLLAARARLRQMPLRRIRHLQMGCSHAGLPTVCLTRMPFEWPAAHLRATLPVSYRRMFDVETENYLRRPPEN